MESQSLDEAMDQRRIELGVEWKDIATTAGVSYETIRALRRQTRSISALNIHNVEDALRWERGSIQAVLDGDQPTPTEDIEPEPEDDGDGPRDEWERGVWDSLSSVSVDARRALLTLARAARADEITVQSPPQQTVRRRRRRA